MVFIMLIVQFVFAVACLFSRIDRLTFTWIIIITNVFTWARSIVVVRQKKEENRIAEKERRERQRREMLKGGANNGQM